MWHSNFLSYVQREGVRAEVILSDETKSHNNRSFAYAAFWVERTELDSDANSHAFHWKKMCSFFARKYVRYVCIGRV